MSIAFTTTVMEKDWDSELSGWRCPALRIPGASVNAVFVAGSRVDTAWYEVLTDHALIRWVRQDHPDHAVLSIKLTQELSTQELTLRWKKVAVILPIVSALIAALVTYLTSEKPLPQVNGGNGSVVNRNSNANSNASIPRTVSAGEHNEELKKVGQFVIEEPKNNDTFGITTEIRGRTPYADMNHYVLVTSLQWGATYVQTEDAKVNLDGTWSCPAIFGTATDGRGKRWKIQALATRSTLLPGLLLARPPDQILSSNEVTITRVRD